MPSLAIIPARAVADERLSDTHLRVLCALGTHTNKLGGNVWASVKTLATESALSERTVQRATIALIESGYVRVVERPGRTNLYEVLLDTPPTPQSPGGDTPDGGGVTTQSPERLSERYTQRKARKSEKESDRALSQMFTDATFQQAMDAIWQVYPPRPVPYPFVGARRAVAEACLRGGSLMRLVQAARRYAATVQREQTDPQYVKGIIAFYRDDTWEHFTEATVHGRTREEWARSGQDVAQFDRYLEEQDA